MTCIRPRTSSWLLMLADVRVSDGSAAAQAYACDGRCNHQLEPLRCFFRGFHAFHRFIVFLFKCGLNVVLGGGESCLAFRDFCV